MNIKDTAKFIVVAIAVVGLTTACADKRGFRAAKFADQVDGKEKPGANDGGDGGKSNSDDQGGGTPPPTVVDPVQGSQDIRLEVQEKVQKIQSTTTETADEASGEPAEDAAVDMTGLEETQEEAQSGDWYKNQTSLLDMIGVNQDQLNLALSAEKIATTRSVIAGSSLWADAPVETDGKVEQYIELQSIINLNCQQESVVSFGRVTNDQNVVMLFSSVVEGRVQLPEVKVFAYCTDESCAQINVITSVDSDLQPSTAPVIAAQKFVKDAQNENTGFLTLAKSSLGKEQISFEEARGNIETLSEECKAEISSDEQQQEEQQQGSESTTQGQSEPAEPGQQNSENSAQDEVNSNDEAVTSGEDASIPTEDESSEAASQQEEAQQETVDVEEQGTEEGEASQVSDDEVQEKQEIDPSIMDQASPVYSTEVKEDAESKSKTENPHAHWDEESSEESEESPGLLDRIRGWFVD